MLLSASEFKRSKMDTSKQIITKEIVTKSRESIKMKPYIYINVGILERGQETKQNEKDEQHSTYAFMKRFNTMRRDDHKFKQAFLCVCFSFLFR